MNRLSHRLCNFNTELKQQGLFRQRLGNLITASPTPLLNFCSNDYLSLANDLAVRRAFQRGFSKYAAGSSASLVVSGYHVVHRDLERAFAAALNADDALLFTSGYNANLSIILLLAKFADHILIDKAVHASFYDGLKLATANYARYLSNIVASLQKKLAILSPSIEAIAIVTETVFSMSGVIAALKDLAQVAKNYDASLIIDEAHAFGVFGPQGLGIGAAVGLTQHEVPLRIITFGKALAHQGAIVVGKGEWIAALLQAARPLIYSTAISPALVYGLLETFAIIRAADARRQKLYQLIDYFRAEVKASPFKWANSVSPIQQLQLGCPHKALCYTNFLYQNGIFCQAIRAPTVTTKETGLRIVLNYHHKEEDISHLFTTLKKLYDGEC